MFAQNEVHCDVTIIRHYVIKPEVMYAMGSKIHVLLVNRGGGGGLTKMPKVCTGRHRCSQKYIIIPGKH